MHVKLTLLEERLAIPPKIKAVITNINDVKNWKTPVWLFNNASKEEKEQRKRGDLDNVGFVAFGRNTKAIVPIARLDEHQIGMEVIYWLMDQKIIPRDDYYTLWLKDTPYYYSDRLSSPEYKRGLFSAIRLFIANGGNPKTIMLDYTQYDKKAKITMENLLLGKTPKTSRSKNDPLSSMGKSIIENLETFIQLYSKSLSHMDVDEKLIDMCDSILVSISYYMSIRNIKDDVFEYVQFLKDKFLKSRTADKAYYIILGTNGVKNVLHTKLKKEEKNKTSPYYQLFGNINKAIQEFNRLGEY